MTRLHLYMICANSLSFKVRRNLAKDGRTRIKIRWRENKSKKVANENGITRK